MACSSQSLSSYSLLRCIVSAAQFAGGELSFGTDYAELVAMDATGETTTPLRIQYDDLIHFRLIREQQLMRIELPKAIAQRWAESNGFTLEPGNENDCHQDGGHDEGTCAFIHQLSVDDMSHFLQSIAPVVAASRRTRSVSRVSMTEPLPLSYYPQSPSGAEVAGGTDTSSHVGDGASIGEKDCNDTIGDDCEYQNTEVGNRGEAADKDDVISTSASFLSAHTLEGFHLASKLLTERMIPGVHADERHDDGHFGDRDRMGDGKGVRRAEVVCGAASAGAPSEPAGSEKAILVRRTKSKRGRGFPISHAADGEECKNGGSIETEDAPPPLLRRRGRNWYCKASPSCSDLAGGPTTPQEAAVSNPSLAATPLAQDKSSVIHDMVPPAGVPVSTFVMYNGSDAKVRDVGDTAETSAAYNFADIVTVPSAADHLPVTVDARRLLADLHAVLPGRRRTTAKRPRARQQTRKGPVERGRGKKATVTEATITEVPQWKSTKLATEEKDEVYPKVLTGKEGVRVASVEVEDTEVAAPELETPLINPRAFYLSREAHREPSPPLQEIQCTDTCTHTGGSQPKASLECVLNTPSNPPAAPQSPVGALSPLSEYRVDALPVLPNGDACANPGDAPNSVVSGGVAAGADGVDDSSLLGGALLSTDDARRLKGLGKRLSGGRRPMRPSKSDMPSAHLKTRRHHLHRGRCGSPRPPPPAPSGVPYAAYVPSRKNRWRQVVRQLNTLSLCLAKARACGEELRGLFLIMLEEAEI